MHKLMGRRGRLRERKDMTREADRTSRGRLRPSVFVMYAIQETRERTGGGNVCV